MSSTTAPRTKFGTVVATKTISIGALSATQTTQIRWVTDATPNAFTTQADYKRVTVTINRSSDGRQLTPREREIAQLVARGYSNKVIAARLNISTRTVENHVASIFGRLSIRARWQLTPDLLEG